MTNKILCFIGIALLLHVSIIDAQLVTKHGQLKVDGVFLMDENDEVIVLNGVSYGWHNWWPRFYNEESVKWLAEDWGCSVVRAAMGVGPDKGYTDKPEWSKEKIEAVINGAIKSDIYVIIDWHSHHIEIEAAKEFFSEMAEKYGSYPHIIYEIFNEPVRDSWTDVKSYSIEVIKAIREYDKNNIILVGCPHWDQDIHIVADDPIVGYNNLMYTVHFYADAHGQDLRDKSNYALEKGIPIFISESAGMSSNGDGPINYKEWNAWIDWMQENSLSWISWSVADKNETCSMLNKSADSKGNWTEEDLKESGIKTREMLREIRLTSELQ